MSTDIKPILLVDDDLRDIELTLAALEENNLANNVDVARDGEQALDYMYRRGIYKNRPEGNPAVVLLDLKMPKINELQVLEKLKTCDLLKQVPIVVLTGSKEESYLIRSYKLGVNAYVVKPMDFAELVQEIRQLGLFWVLTSYPPPGSVNTRR